MAILLRSPIHARGLVAIVVGTVLALFPAYAPAQTAAILYGSITDSSGAAVAGARIVLVEAGTNIERATTSNAGGEYRFGVLPIGPYSIDVSSPGLKRATLANLVVEVGRTIAQDFRLEVGDA